MTSALLPARLTAGVILIALCLVPTALTPTGAAAATHSCGNVSTSAPAVFEARHLSASQGIRCSVARKVATPIAGGSRPGAKGSGGVAVVVGKTAWDCFFNGALSESDTTPVRCKPTPADSDFSRFGKARISFEVVPAS